jgi:alanyl-tRNA synthetase
VDGVDQRGLNALADAVRQKLGDAAVVLAATADERVLLVANFAPAAVERGLKAGEIVKAAAQVAGGGGGGRDNLAQAGGRNPEKLPEALTTARMTIERALA